MNFLEELVAEWKQYTGYIVRRNIRFGKRKRGGYSGEIDILSFEPRTKKLSHIETTSNSPKDLKKPTFTKKFINAKDNYYKDIFPFEYSEIEKTVILAPLSKTKKVKKICTDVNVKSCLDLMEEIIEELSTKDPSKMVIPEDLPLLRAIQYTIYVLNKKR